LSTAPLKPSDLEYTAITVVMARITECFEKMGCPPKLAIVAVKLWLHVTDEVTTEGLSFNNETPEECQERMRVIVDKLWLETPDPRVAKEYHA
jgi:hypothetical protein